MEFLIADDAGLKGDVSPKCEPTEVRGIRVWSAFSEPVRIVGTEIPVICRLNLSFGASCSS